MNKILVGVIVGGILGVVDGATAWFTPAVREQMLGIIIGSTMKGVIAGVAAGWFARRVQSVPKGIAFGFAVGLLLAFAVAAMPSATGEHYWWQIMVPGSILGGVIGWATQRYGRPAGARPGAAALAMCALAFFGLNAYAGEGHGHDHAKPAASATAAFEKLKALAGSHSPNQMTADGKQTKVEYRVTAGGTAIVETMFVGDPHEMMTVYTLDGSSIVATHFCSGGNQPVLRLNAAKSNANELFFDFEKISGDVKPGHINGVRFRFGDGGRVEEAWKAGGEEHVKLFYAPRQLAAE